MSNEAREPEARPDSGASRAPFPVAGIGATAGGLEAVERFLFRMPLDSGIAFVLVMHPTPARGECVAERIRQVTGWPVEPAREFTMLRPGTLFLAPAGRNIAIRRNIFRVVKPEGPQDGGQPVDSFFRSLAEDRRGEAIGIIFSGTGSDGADGLLAIREAGGMAIAREGVSARSAGAADFLLSPEEMPEQLLRHIHHPAFDGTAAPALPPNAASDSLEKITLTVRDVTGHDFSQYKKNTLIRRIGRRMAVCRYERMEEYIRALRCDPREVERLFREFLIGVTGFFRDPEAFEALRNEALPLIFENRSPGDRIRAWVAGCSTGEEAYSLAMIFREYLEERRREHPVVIFATDIDRAAVETARAGFFPGSISGQVSPERLARFFAPENKGYRIKKEIRDMVVFAPQSIIKDPPFIRLDLVSCRNLLIYLDADLQRKVMPFLHFSLNKGGILFLGPSESLGRFSELFSPVDRKWKIYRKRGLRYRGRMDFPPGNSAGLPAGTGSQGEVNRENIRDLVERALLRDFAPPGVLVDERGDILFISGQTGKFLEPAAGETTLNILDLARDGLRTFLAIGLRQAVEKNGETCIRDIRVRTGGGYSLVRVTVRPAGKNGMLLVVFEEKAGFPESGEDPPAPGAEEREHIAQLERELGCAREYLQATIEELKSSREELQSLNEELDALNSELGHKAGELSRDGGAFDPPANGASG